MPKVRVKPHYRKVKGRKTKVRVKGHLAHYPYKKKGR